MLFTQACCRNAMRDARLTVHLLRNCKSFSYFSSARPPYQMFCLSLSTLSTQAHLPARSKCPLQIGNVRRPPSANFPPAAAAHHSHFGHSGLAFAFQFIRYVSCSAHLTTSRLISFANYHQAPRSYWPSLSCCFGVVSTVKPAY